MYIRMASMALEIYHSIVLHSFMLSHYLLMKLTVFLTFAYIKYFITQHFAVHAMLNLGTSKPRNSFNGVSWETPLKISYIVIKVKTTMGRGNS